MPEVYVHLAEGRTPEQIRSVLTGVTSAVVTALGVAAESVVVSVIETPRAMKAKGGVPFTER